MDDLEERMDRFASRPKRPGEKQEARMEKLDRCLLARKNEAMTFSEIGKILELGSRDGKTNTRPQAMTKFGKILESKKTCYVISDSNTQKGGKLVKLTKEYYQHCKSELFGP